jgi:thioredoxin-like negative regulator of GroEL
MKTLYYFSTPTCAPCKLMAPLIKSMVDAGQITVKKFDLGQTDDVVPMAIAKSLGVSAVPTLILVDETNGVTRLKSNLVGAQKQQAILDYFNN